MKFLSMLNALSQVASRYFAIWVLLAAIIGLLHPSTFRGILPHVSLLLGVIMFGMGMTLRVEDFREVLVRPKEVAVGVVAQYTIMPLLAYGIAEAFRLPGEIAVGVVLLGACPGGTASNVITYLAKGDVALSVAMTTASTLISPVMTPLSPSSSLELGLRSQREISSSPSSRSSSSPSFWAWSSTSVSRRL